MRILLDDRECSFKADSVGAAVAQGAEVAERSGRLIVDVFVDGQRWSTDDLGSKERVGSDADEVRLVSVDPAALLRETFLQAADALAEAEGIQRQAARLIQGDQEKQGMELLLEAIGLWSNIQEAASQGLTLAQIDASTVRTDEGSFDEATRDLSDRLRTIRDAMRVGDAVAVSDCLLYEFPPTTQRWTALLTELARLCDARRETPRTEGKPS